MSFSITIRDTHHYFGRFNVIKVSISAYTDTGLMHVNG